MSSPPQIDGYVLHDLIGESFTGSVWSADYQEQSPLAIKVLNPQAINRQFLFDTLVKVLNGAPHPGVNGIYDFDLASETPYITSALHADRVALDNGNEYWQSRSLESLCGQLDEDEVWRYVHQVVDALAHLHRLRVAHTGLKPANVLLDEESPAHIKITDIGMGIVSGADKVEASDTLCYAAPEQLRAPDQQHDGRAERWDVYSFGVLAFRLMTGQFPRLRSFIDELRRRRATSPEKAVLVDLATLAATIDKRPDVEWPVPTNNPVEEKHRKIIEACLAINPDQRFADMRDVQSAFETLEASLRKPEGETPAPLPVKAEGVPPKRSKLLMIGAAGCAVVAGLLTVGHLKEGGLSRLWSAVKLQNTGGSGPNFRNAENGDLITDDPVEKEAHPGDFNNNEVKKDDLVGELLEELRMSSETVDEVFRSLISRDATGNAVFAVPDGTLGSLLAYYEDFAHSHQSNPELLYEAAHAFNSAGEIKIALNDIPGAIQSIGSATLLLEPAYKAAPDNGPYLLSLAFFKHNLAEAQKQGRLPKASLVNARASTELYETLDERNPNSPQAQRSLVRSYVYLGNGLSDAGQFGEADLILDRAQTVIKKLSEASGETEADIAALSRIEHERALLAFRRDKRKEATTHLISAIDSLLDPLLKSEPGSLLYRGRLGASYGLLADVLLEDGSTGDASEANNQAIALLVELTEELPDKEEYRSQLAARFMTLADLERDAGKNKDAIAAAQKALTLYDDIVKRSAEHPKNKFDLAICYRLLADLQLDAKNKDEALIAGNEALKLVQELLKDDTDPENDNLKRPEYRIAMADYYDAMGHQCETLGRKEDAKTCYEKAITHYEYLATDKTWPDQEGVQKGLAESKASLTKLQ